MKIEYWGEYPFNGVAGNIVEKILRDMTDRRGLSEEWDGIDLEIQVEAIEKWIEIVKTEISLGSSRG